MTCPVREEIYRLDDPALTSLERYRLEAHLGACAECAALEETLDVVEQALRAAPLDPLGVVGPALGALRPRRRMPIAAAAAVLLASGAAFAFWPRAQPHHAVARTVSVELPLPPVADLDGARARLFASVEPTPTQLEELAAEFAGPRGSMELARLLRTRDRERVLRLLPYALAEEMAEPLTELLDDPRCARRAAGLLGQLGLRRTVPALGAALGGPAAVEAREALVAIGGEGAIRFLVADLRDQGSAEAFDALVRVSPRRAALAGSRWAVECRRAELLPELRRVATGDDIDLAIGAAAALVRDPVAVDALQRLGRRPEGRAAAVRSLAAIGTADALEVAFEICCRAGGGAELVDAFDGADHAESFLLGHSLNGTIAQRRVALELLAACGGAESLRVLGSEQWRGGLVRAAIATTGAIGGPEAARLLVRWDGRNGLRDELIEALGATGDPSAVPALVALAQRGRTTKVARALGRLPVNVVVPALLEALAERNGARRVRDVLIEVTGEDMGRRSDAWRAWWTTRS